MENNTTFEQALARLEEIVRALESGTAPLDTSLSMFEEGVKLVRFCNDKLDNAEQRIKILTSSGDGSVEEKNFNTDNRASENGNK